MKNLLSLAALLSACALVSCSTTSQVSLDYSASSGHVKPGPPEFSTRFFNDQRGLGAFDLGTVRTQIGTPLEHVQTRVPINEVVTNAFGYGLQSRGMLTRPRVSRYVITGDVMDLYCQMLVRPYGYARIRVTVLDSASGQIIHSRVYTGERGGSAYLPGSGSPVPMLRDLVSGALQDCVDRALDDPALRSKIRSGEMRDMRNMREMDMRQDDGPPGPPDYPAPPEYRPSVTI